MDPQLKHDCQLACVMMKVKPYTTYCTGVQELKFWVESIIEITDDYIIFISHIISAVKFWPSCGGFLNGNQTKMLYNINAREFYLLKWDYDYLTEFEIIGDRLNSLSDLDSYFRKFLAFLQRDESKDETADEVEQTVENLLESITVENASKNMVKNILVSAIRNNAANSFGRSDIEEFLIHGKGRHLEIRTIEDQRYFLNIPMFVNGSKPIKAITAFIYHKKECKYRIEDLSNILTFLRSRAENFAYGVYENCYKPQLVYMAIY